MLGLGLSLAKTSFVDNYEYHSSYQALLDQAQTDGVAVPSLRYRKLQDQLVRQLVSDGIWSLMDNLYFFANGNGSQDFALYNVVNPTGTKATLSSAAPTFDASEGFTGNSSTTTFISTSKKTNDQTGNYIFYDANSINLGSFGAWTYNTKEDGAKSLMGTNVSHNTIQGGGAKIQGLSVPSSLLTTRVSGLYHLNLSSETNDTRRTLKFFKNGAAPSQTLIGEPQTELIDSFYILANNETGNNASNDTVSIAFIGSDMAADNLYSKLYNALNTYMSSL